MKRIGVFSSACAAILLGAAAHGAVIVDTASIQAGTTAADGSVTTANGTVVAGFDDFLNNPTAAELAISSTDGVGVRGGSVNSQISVIAGADQGASPPEVQALVLSFATPQELGSISVGRLFPATDPADNFNEIARIEVRRAAGDPVTVVEVESTSETTAVVRVDGQVADLQLTDITTVSNAWLLDFGLSKLFDGVTELVLLPGNTTGRASQGSDFTFLSLTDAEPFDPVPLPGAAILFGGGLVLMRLVRRR